MWLLGPLCLLLSSAAGESWGRPANLPRGSGRGGRAPTAPPPRARAASPRAGVQGGRTRRRAGRDPGEGPRRGARGPIVWACAPAPAASRVRGRGFVWRGPGEPGSGPDWA